MEEQRTISTEEPIVPTKRKSSAIKYCCGACGILFVLIVGGILLMFLFVEKSCQTNFNIPNIFSPSPSAPVPPGGIFPEDFSNLPTYTILERYRDKMSIGVNADVKEDDLKKLNRYLVKTYFTGLKVFNIAYFNTKSTSELIAVYNFNSFTGTDNFTMLEAEPGARFPAK